MKSLVTAFVFVPIVAIAAPSEVPDPSKTPGAVAETDALQLCHASPSYSQTHRRTSEALKRTVRQEYGDFAGDREVDHLIPLCAGGADAKENLWLQPGVNQGVSFPYEAKDRLEAEACRQICSGAVTPQEAQSWFPGDWRVKYCQLFQDDACASLGQSK